MMTLVTNDQSVTEIFNYIPHYILTILLVEPSSCFYLYKPRDLWSWYLAINDEMKKIEKR